MKNFDKTLYFASAYIVLLILAAIPSTAQQSYDGTLDIALLMRETNARYDLSKEDVIILLDRERIKLEKDARYAKLRHSIVWLNSNEAAVRYGQIRIPYDSRNCDLEIMAARVWRDSSWIDTDKSKFVESTPEVLSKCKDYSNVKEMAVNIEGIKLPCIVELAYTIADKEPFRRGWEGSWTFQRDDPAIKSWFEFQLPIDWWPNISEKPGLPAPIKTTDQDTGLDLYSWQRGPFDPLPFPKPADPGETDAYIIWSTYRDWASLGADFRTKFDNAAVGDQKLKDKLDSIVVGKYTARNKVRSIAKFIRENVKYINYPWAFWLSSPRTATEIYNSGYAQALDRAVMAAAMFSKAGVNTLPVFICPDYGKIDPKVPGLARLSRFGLWMSGEDLAAFYDPFDGMVKSGPEIFYCRMAWSPGADEKPYIRINGFDKTSQNDVSLVLHYDKDKKKFIGSGYFVADKFFAPYQEMAGLNNEAITYLDNLISSLFEKAKVTSYNPSDFNRNRVAFGFQFEFDRPDLIDGQIPLVVGESNGGILSKLPYNVELFHNVRTLPLHFPGLLSQKVELIIDLNNLDLGHYPKDTEVRNETGEFLLKSELINNELRILRSLSLSKADYTGDEWLSLRSLFLADRNEENRLILLDD